MSNRPECITASGLGKVIACPRSFQLEKLCPQSESEFAAEGTRKHNEMALWGRKFFGNEMPDISKEDDVKFCQEKAREIAVDFCGKDLFTGTPLIEQRLSIGDRLSGQMDFAYVRRNGKAIVLDYKFGMGQVADAIENPQLMAYALLMFANYDLNSCEVCILQPNAFGRKMTKATYTIDMFDAMLDKVNAIIAKANSKAAPYADSIGDYCQYCRAKAICEKQKQNAIEVAENTGIEVASNFTITADNCLDVFDRLQHFKDRFNQAKKYLDLVQSNLEAFARENPNCGLGFKQGARVFKCTDIRAFLGDYMARTGASYEDILPALKIEKKGLDEVSKAKGIKPKELAEFYSGLAGCEFAQNKDRLTKERE